MRVNELFAFLSRHRVSRAAAGTLMTGMLLAGCDSLKPPEACSVTIAPQNITLGVNGSQQVVGTAFDCKGNTLRNKRPSYSSNNTLVATVTPDGIVLGVAVGQTTISATSDGNSASTQVTVTPEAAASVTVSPSPYVMRVGGLKQFTAVAKNSRDEVIAGRTFQWASSNSSVASVDGNGNVTAFTPGNITVTATTDNRVGSTSIQVTLMPLQSCTLTPANQKITINGQFQPTMVLRDSAGQIVPNNSRTMLWSSDNEVNATVTSSGVVTARRAGTAKISASWNENPTVRCDMTVELVEPRIVSAVISPRSQTLRLGIPRQHQVELRDSAQNIIPLAGRTVTWSSTAPTVVNVSPTGLATGLSLASARIAVNAEGAVDTINVNVTRIPVASVRVTPSQSTVIQGGTVQLNAIVEDSVGNTVTDRTVEWTTNDPQRAIVSQNGLVQTFGTGSVTVTASSENRSGNGTVIIQQVAADSIMVVDTIYNFTTTQANKSFGYSVVDAQGNLLLNRSVNVQSSNPAIAQSTANPVTTGTIVLGNTPTVGTTVFTLRALNALGQPEGKITRVTVNINAPPTPVVVPPPKP